MRRETIRRFFIGPALAVARVGSGRTPLDNFTLVAPAGANTADSTPEIRPALTLDIDDNGEIIAFTPRRIRFKAPNKHGRPGFRPVCPWFELWCETEDDTGYRATRPVLPDDFASGFAGVSWDIELANRKAFGVTRSRGDIVRSPRTTIAPGDTSRHLLFGWSQDARGNEPPLVSRDKPIPLGALQAARPHRQYGFRVRFTPPSGQVFGPSDLAERLADHQRDSGGGTPAPAWQHLGILRRERRDDFLILNPQARWCGGQPSSDADPIRVAPGLLRAVAAQGTVLPGGDLAVPLGLLDDLSDGIIGCAFEHDGQAQRVCARVVVGPPDFTPDRRPTVAFSDALVDRAYQSDRSMLGGVRDATNDLPRRSAEEIAGRVTACIGAGRATAPRAARPSPLDLRRSVNAPPNDVTGQPAHGNSPDKIPPGRSPATVHLTRWQYDLLGLWARGMEEDGLAPSRQQDEGRDDR